MSLLAASQECRTRAGRLATAVLAIGWLGFAVAPCQAMNVMPDEAPHHGSVPMDDCGHCPPATSTLPDCADAVPAVCFSSSQPAIELLQQEQLKPVAILPPVSVNMYPLAPAVQLPRHSSAQAAPLPRASLQQRYCSYLE